jgi:hypothetical protein
VKSAPLLLTSTVVRIPELDGGVVHSSKDDVTHRARLLIVLLLCSPLMKPQLNDSSFIK